MLMIGTCICRIAWMGAKLHVDICTVPAHIVAFYFSGHALGMYHS